MGSVIKNNVIESLSPRMVRFNLSDVRMEASVIMQKAYDELERAKAESREMIERAKMEAEAIRETARTEGYQTGFQQGVPEGHGEGRRQGFEEAKQEFTGQNQQLRTMLEDLFTKFNAQREHFLTQAYQDTLTLALAVAVKVTRRQARIDPGVILENVKAAVNLAASRSDCVVKMNPADLERFELLDPEKAQSLLGLNQVKFIAEATVEPGGCLVETANGQIDGQLTTQLNNLIQQLAPDMEPAVKHWARDDVS